MQKFDSRLAITSPSNAYLRTAMRDIACDRYKNSTFDEIVSAESIDLKSTGHASDVCSLLTAYKLLDILYALEHPDALKAPVHQRLRVDFSSLKVLFLFSS